MPRAGDSSEEIKETVREATDDLASLKKQRTSIKRNISNLKNKTEKSGANDDATVLECRLEILETYFKQLCYIQSKIERLNPDDTDRFEFEDIFISAKSKIRTLLNASRVAMNDQSSMNSSCFQDHHQKSRLPTLKLPKFDGRYAEYKRFMDSFTNLVDNDISIPAIEKFNYLLNCLSGAALNVVEAFQVTSENYKKALKRLNERYDNKVIIFLDYIQSLFNITAMKKSDSTSLRKIIDTVSALRSSLLSLGEESDIMNAFIIYLVKGKIDQESRDYYDEKQDFTNLPSWDKCYQVLDRRCLYLESHQQDGKSHQVFKRNSNTFVNAKATCAYCSSSEHILGNCSVFASIPVSERFDFAKRNTHCINCLRKGHTVTRCQSKSRCRICHQSHHSVLHIYSATNLSTNTLPLTEDAVKPQVASTAPVSLITRSTKRALIPTAVIYIKDVSGQLQPVRAILDSCSEINFITEETAKRLQLKFNRTNEEVAGIAGIRTPIRHFVVATIKSRITLFERTTNFSVTRSITTQQPVDSIFIADWKMPDSIILADPEFFKPQRIDLLISTGLFFDLLLEGKISLGVNLPCLVNTEFGWIVGGNYEAPATPRPLTCNLAIESQCENLDTLLQRFWEVEDMAPSTSLLTLDEQKCEDHFVANVEVRPDGRLNVRLPFKKSPELLGESYEFARKRFICTERRLERDPMHKAMYTEFMREYAQLEHMSPVDDINLNKPHYIIPHHSVLRPQSKTTKIRVVFDASARTSSNRSLNDILLVGPTLQQQLIITLMAFRLNKFALIADISKMYRQFMVDKSDRKYQMILWRNETSEPLQIYELNTITYGMSASPFLAIRCLYHIADLYSSTYPVGSKALREDLYVDDLLTGADDQAELQKKRTEIAHILNLHGLSLAKWNSNLSQILTEVADEVPIQLPDDDVAKTLGMSWKPKLDTFCFRYDLPNVDTATKRAVLSIVSRVYDMLGLLSPVIIRSKILLQEIWLQHLNWDDPLPTNLNNLWSLIRNDLSNINLIEIPRYVFTSPQLACEIHGFADASQRAYGCCIYVRSKVHDKYKVTLLIAKSKVAPIKAQSLPRLELCAALLLSRTWQKIQHKLASFIPKIYFWTDSKIVLQWITMHSSTLNCFVANRVAELQDQTSQINWKHVPSKENPADIVSRGCSALELSSTMWFAGPKYLQQSEEQWPQSQPSNTSSAPALELRNPVSLTCSNSSTVGIIESIINNNSSYWRILRIVSYVLRIFNKALIDRSTTARHVLHLPASELNNTFLRIVVDIQRIYFQEERNNLMLGKSLKPSFQKLSPFIDKIEIGTSLVDVIRVGGRLINADIPFDAKFPYLLPKQHRFTQLYIEFLHRTNKHAGPKVLLSLLRQRLWVINAREVVRKVVRNCVHCFHYKPKLIGQLMGSLPANRLRAHRPFLVTGVDFCGPFLTTYRIRGKQPYKTYVAIFVCFASKAVHIELVSDLSTNNFILSLKRFIGRRGVPQQIFCDNATNFVGANNKLKAVKAAFFENQAVNDLLSFSSKTGFDFKFIPPRAPHFGGLWEAAVKSAKTLLVKNAAQASLTFEELQTVLIEIEAILNSRPIAALSDDPNDGEALTPAHLLIGDQLISAPDEVLVDRNISHLTRWQRVTFLKQQFWKMWSRDYIFSLQQRSKWFKPEPNIQVGQLVIIHEDNVAPQQWMLARVTHAMPGSDGRVRVVDLKTAKCTLRRPIHKIAPLPSCNAD